MRKNYTAFVLLLMLSAAMVQCHLKDNTEPGPDPCFEKVDFDKGAIQIMDTLVDHLYGLNRDIKHIKLTRP